MNLKRTLIGLGGLAAALMILAPLAAHAQSGNLLQNPSMEEPYAGCGAGQAANGWKCWYRIVPKPNDASALQYTVQPYFSAETNPSGKFPELIRSGAASQHPGNQQDPWMAGLKQSVAVPANTPLRFCAWARIHASNASLGSEPSYTSINGRARVGIFPNGEAEWDNTGIVWSGEANPHDTWAQLCVTATSGPEGRVTVFTSNDWRGSAAQHLDAWWDDAELVATGGQAAPTAAPVVNQPPATAAPPQPVSTAIPVTRGDGSIVHTIVAGDTLFGLSLQYNVALDDILAYNGLTKESILSIGQEIIIKPATGAQPPAQPQATTAPAQPTVAASNPVTDTTLPAPTATPAAVAEQPQVSAARLCVFAFDDVDGDGLRSPTEGPVANVQFAIANAQGVQAASYTTDGNVEAHCFTDLPPGSYTVAVQPAPNTVPTSDRRWGVALTNGGAPVNINFGSRSESAASANSPESGGAAPTQPAGSGSNITGLLGAAIGLVLLLVAGVLGAFVIARRRA